MAEKKVKTAKKTIKKKPDKKLTQNKKKARKPALKPKKKVTRKKSVKSNGNKPVLVLLILCLLTIIVLLVNNFYLSKKLNNINMIKIKVTTGDKVVNQKDDSSNIKQKDLLKEKNDDKIKAKIYFIKFNEKTEKIYLTSVNRKVSTKNKVEGALTELIRGLQPGEKKKGMLTAIPSGLKIRKVEIKKRTAEIDFNTAIGAGAQGNILLSRIDQIVYTATQFKEIDNIVIKINGRSRKTVGSHGLSINGPLYRRR